jgi:hypothetical protein
MGRDASRYGGNADAAVCAGRREGAPIKPARAKTIAIGVVKRSKRINVS